jgi:hypothetical protein
MLFMDNLRENSDEFCDAGKLHECTFMPFSVVECITIGVLGSYKVMHE